MYIDPSYFIVVGPFMLLGLWAQWKVKSAFNAGHQVRASSGLSGAETAQAILDAKGIRGVGIEMAQGFLGDHYDPRGKVLRLSQDVYHGRSLAALGVAAHEVGHALQDAERYAPLVVRNGIVPIASLGTQASTILFIGGMIMNAPGLIFLGIAAYSLIVIFQVVNLPVEFNASSRAREILLAQGIVTGPEDETVGKVLNAAALTYVAATLTSIATLAYYLMRFAGNDRD